MKKFLLSIFFLHSIFCCAQYESLLSDSTRQWNIYNSNSWHYVDESIDRYTLGSTISSITSGYTEIYGTIKISSTPILFGYLREDTVSGKLWFSADTANINNDFLVYDLSLNTGDTMAVHSYPFAPKLLVDTVYYINGKKHLKLHLLQGYNYNLDFATHRLQYFYDTLLFIEGVGTSRGFQIDPSFAYFNQYYSNGSDYLICAYKDSSPIYQPVMPSVMNPIVHCDSVSLGIFTSIEDNSNKNLNMIYPNPATGIVQIQTDKRIENIEVLDLQGRISTSLNGTAVEMSTNKEIELPSPSGVYLLRIHFKDGTVATEKVMKQ